MPILEARGDIARGSPTSSLMPLTTNARKYADMLYQKDLAKILAQQVEELGKIAADFGARGMMMSGNYESARGRILANSAGQQVRARVESLLRAYEKAGQKVDEAVANETVAEIRTFRDAKKQHLLQASRNLMQQNLGQPAPASAAAAAVASQMDSLLEQATSAAIQDIMIKAQELKLEDELTHKGYAAAMGKEWDVFISHASEDKDFVLPLAAALENSGLRVWLDKSELTVGDSLRRKIDEGLSRSRFGIVILSPHFFDKPWPEAELDGLVAKEISGIKVILPIWHKIDFHGVSDRSPMLAGRLAARTSDGLEKVVSDLRAGMGLPNAVVAAAASVAAAVPAAAAAIAPQPKPERIAAHNDVGGVSLRTRNKGVIPGTAIKVVEVFGAVENRSPVKRIAEYSCTLCVPECCISFSEGTRHTAEIPSNLAGYRKFRHTEKSHSGVQIFPGDTLQVVSVDIALDHLPAEQRLLCSKMELIAEVIVGDELFRTRKAIASLMGE